LENYVDTESIETRNNCDNSASKIVISTSNVEPDESDDSDSSSDSSEEESVYKNYPSSAKLVKQQVMMPPKDLSMAINDDFPFKNRDIPLKNNKTSKYNQDDNEKEFDDIERQDSRLRAPLEMPGKISQLGKLILLSL
jgi:transposase